MASDFMPIRDVILSKISGPRCLLLGAGASAAVGLPTMVSFLEQALGEQFVRTLPSRCPPYVMGSNDVNQIRKNREVVLRRLFHSANLGRKEINYDLEALFQFIYGSGVGTTRWRQEEDVKRLFWMFQESQNKADFSEFSTQYERHRATLEQWMNDVEDAVAELRRQLYQQFLITSQRQPVLERGAKVFRFLESFFPEGAAVVFTLNFDTVFEALDDAKALGWHLLDGVGASRRTKYFDFANFAETAHDGRPLYLFKMHGSVTWLRDGENLRDTYPSPATASQTASVALAEPVVSKRTSAFPFGEMYDLLRSSLETKRACVAIGLSFRDDNLRELVEERLADSKFHLVMVAPEDSKYPDVNRYLHSLSERPNVEWIKGYFGDDSTNTAILEATKAAEAVSP